MASRKGMCAQIGDTDDVLISSAPNSLPVGEIPKGAHGMIVAFEEIESMESIQSGTCLDNILRVILFTSSIK